MLNKLVDISHGKWSSVKGPGTQGPGTLKKKRISESTGPRSLNISIRKRENERIERENHAFAKRLYENRGQISKVKHDQDYLQHLELKQRVQRVKKNLPGFNGKATQLPPLDDTVFKKQKKSMYSNKASAKSGMSKQNLSGRFKSSSPARPYHTHQEQDYEQNERLDQQEIEP